MSSLSTYAYFDHFFSPEELKRIVQLGDGLIHQRAMTNVKQLNAQIRVTRVAWINPDLEHKALFERVGDLIQHLNRQFFNFEIDGLEPLQYTVYESSEGGHYDWHMDSAATNPRPRKLSLSLQLSDPADYKGCDLQFQFGAKVETAPRRYGTAIAFPSFYWHRVTPIGSGTRKALVMWASGPQFK